MFNVRQLAKSVEFHVAVNYLLNYMPFMQICKPRRLYNAKKWEKRDDEEAFHISQQPACWCVGHSTPCREIQKLQQLFAIVQRHGEVKREIPSRNLVDRSSQNDMSESCLILSPHGMKERTLLDYHIDVKLLEKYGNSEIHLNECKSPIAQLSWNRVDDGRRCRGKVSKVAKNKLRF